MNAIVTHNSKRFLCPSGAILAGILSLLLSLVITTTQAEVGRRALPTSLKVQSVTPDQLTQGQSATLLIHGSGLRTGMQVELGDGVSVGNLSMINDSSARISVRVQADALPGRRILAIVVDGVRHAQRPVVTISARALGNESASSLTPPTRAGSEPPKGLALSTRIDSPQAAAPTTLSLQQVTPNRLQRGRYYTLTLKGQGFAAGLSVDFGDGIELRGPVQVQDSSQAIARVQVIKDTPPGFRTLTLSLPSPTNTTAIAAMPNAGQHTEAPRAVEVVNPALAQPTAPIKEAITPPPVRGGFAPTSPGTGFAPPPLMPMAPPPAALPKITRITPDHLIAGKQYSLTLEGEHLQSQLHLDFGAGVSLQGQPLSAGKNRLMVTVKLDKQAKSGTRKVSLATRVGEIAKEQSAQFVIAAAPTRKKPIAKLVTPKLPQFDLVEILKGKIDLQSPDWRQNIASQAPMTDPVTGKPLGPPTTIYDVDIPLLNDEVLFTWKESNPGTAEWFEIRFYAKGELVTKRRIDPVTVKLLGKNRSILPTWFRPDAPLLVTLLKQEAPAGQSTVGNTGGMNLSTQPVDLTSQAQMQAAASPAQALVNAQLLWEVAGYRKYHNSGVVKTALTELPIQLAAAAQVAPKTMTDALPANPQAGFVETEVSLSERWPLKRPAAPTGLGCASESGSLTLVNLDKDSQQQGGALTVEAGDGHVGDRFRLSGSFKLNQSPYASHPQTHQSTYDPPFGDPQVFATTWGFDNLFVDWGDGTLTPFSMTQLGDAQDYNADKTLSLGEGRQHSYAGTGPYTVRLYQLPATDVQGGGQHVAVQAIDKQQDLYAMVSQLTTGANTGQQQMKWSQSVADRAYMLFCRNLQIEPRSDPASHGPLQLVEIGIDGFAGQQSDTSQGILNKSGSQRKTMSKSLSPTAGNVQATDLVQSKPQLGIIGEALPTFSSCDEELTAEAALRYYGQGKARLRWRLDGLTIGEEERSFGPSQPRSQQDLAKLAGKHSWYDLTPVAPPKTDLASGLPSPPVGLSSLGKHALKVEAEVIPEPKSSGLYGTLAAAFGANGMQPNAALVKSLADQFKHAPKIGVLSPSQVAQPGLPAVSYLNQPLQQLAGEPAPIQLAALSLNLGTSVTLSDATFSAASEVSIAKGPPNFVASEAYDFKVAGADKTQACRFEFPVPGGSFTVAGLQSSDGNPKVSEHNGLYDGKGTLLIKLQAGAGAVKQWPVPISFKGWQLKLDKVIAGKFTIDKTGLTDLPLPALKVSLAKLQGEAGVGVDAWLNARLAHSELLETQTGTPPAWQNVKGVLSPEGDWYASGLSMADTRLYLGGFRIDPLKVSLDLSSQQGAASSGCDGGTETQFIGVGLGNNALLSAYDFSLKGTPTVKVDNWGIDASGVCGKANLGAFESALGKGQIAWDGITVTADSGKLKASYQNLRVKVPWIDAELKGQADPVFTAGQGAGSMTLALKGTAAPVSHGPITLEATNLALTQQPGIGWAVSSDTRFDFAGADKTFAKDVWLADLMFGMDGRAYLPNGSKAATLTSTAGFIAQGPVNVKSALVTAPTSGPQRLQFDFLADLQLSKSLQAADMPVSYRISENNGSYQGSGPVLGTVPVTFAFPMTDTVTKGVIHPEYVAGSLGPTASADPPPPLSWIATADALSKQVIYRGTTKMDFLKSMPLPVDGQFELGYYGSDDYWAAVLNYDIPPPGMTVVPNLLNLYSLGGGLGYNVEKGSLSNNLASVTPKITGNSVYGANLTLGSAFDGGFAYTLKGYFNIDPSDPGLNMDFGLWLLSNSHGGSPPINGTLTYGSGIFHAGMGGEQKILGDFARVYANPGALQAHFEDSGDWHLYAGTKDNPVQGEVAKLIDGGVWLNIGRDEGYRLGAKVDAKLPDITCDSGTCAYVSGNVLADVSITPQPIHASADNTVNVSAKGCLGGCLSLGVDASMHVAGPSPELGFGFGLNGCPIGKLSVSLDVVPSIDPGISASLCSPYEMGEAIVEGAEELAKGVGNAITSGAEGVYNAGKDLVCTIFC